MLEKIKLNNFKSHKQTEIQLGNFTLLCGGNGVGKSSLIQMLLLLREAYIKDRTFDILDLKSNPVKIGNVSDAIYEFGDYDGFQTILDFTNELSLDLLYEARSEKDKTKSFIELNFDKSINKNLIKEDFDKLKMLSLFNSNFQYISAARLGPLERYEKDDKIVDVHRQISVLEGKAEYFVHFLDKNRNKDILEELCIFNEESKGFKDLFTQVLLWEKYIFNGANTEVSDIGKLGYELRYSFDNKKSSTKKTQGYDAKNVGFGLSYTLPILVAVLSAQKGALIVIENPEAHLHPNGISKLTELLCVASQAGIQIIVETHSDHVINGVLVQTINHQKNDKKGIHNELVKVYQFYRDENDNCTTSTELNVLENGKLDKNADGFFDQIQSDLEKILDF